MNNLTLIFSSIDISKNPVKKFTRRKSYLTSLNSIIRWANQSSKICLVDNSGFFNSIKSGKFVNKLEKKIIILKSNHNLGKNNKGLGELSMLEFAHKEIGLRNYDFIYFFTGRHFLTCPYILEKFNTEDVDIIVSKPKFYYLSGEKLNDGDIHSYNDMFFGMRSDVMVDYIQYFDKNRNRLEDMSIGSEQLLYEFIELYKKMRGSEKVGYLKALGVLRFRNNFLSETKKLEIL